MRLRRGTKLTEAAVVAIYGKFHYDGVTLKRLSLEYGCDMATIGRVVRVQSWKGIKRPTMDEWLAMQAEDAPEAVT